MKDIGNFKAFFWLSIYILVFITNVSCAQNNVALPTKTGNEQDKSITDEKKYLSEDTKGMFILVKDEYAWYKWPKLLYNYNGAVKKTIFQNNEGDDVLDKPSYVHMYNFDPAWSKLVNHTLIDYKVITNSGTPIIQALYRYIQKKDGTAKTFHRLYSWVPISSNTKLKQLQVNRSTKADEAFTDFSKKCFKFQTMRIYLEKPAQPKLNIYAALCFENKEIVMRIIRFQKFMGAVIKIMPDNDEEQLFKDNPAEFAKKYNFLLLPTDAQYKKELLVYKTNSSDVWVYNYQGTELVNHTLISFDKIFEKIQFFGSSLIVFTMPEDKTTIRDNYQTISNEHKSSSRQQYYLSDYSSQIGFAKSSNLQWLENNIEITMTYYSQIEQSQILEARQIDTGLRFSGTASKGKVNFISYKYDEQKRKFFIWNTHTINFKKDQYVMDVRSIKTQSMVHRYIKLFTLYVNFDTGTSEATIQKNIEKNSVTYFASILDDFEYKYFMKVLGPYVNNNLPDVMVEGWNKNSWFNFWIKSVKLTNASANVDGAEAKFNYPVQWVHKETIVKEKAVGHYIKFAEEKEKPVDITINYSLEDEKKTTVGDSIYYSFCKIDNQNCNLGFTYDPLNPKFDETIIKRKFKINERLNNSLSLHGTLRGSFYQLDKLENFNRKQDQDHLKTNIKKFHECNLKHNEKDEIKTRKIILKSMKSSVKKDARKKMKEETEKEQKKLADKSKQNTEAKYKEQTSLNLDSEFTHIQGSLLQERRRYVSLKSISHGDTKRMFLASGTTTFNKKYLYWFTKNKKFDTYAIYSIDYDKHKHTATYVKSMHVKGKIQCVRTYDVSKIIYRREQYLYIMDLTNLFELKLKLTTNTCNKFMIIQPQNFDRGLLCIDNENSFYFYKLKSHDLGNLEISQSRLKVKNQETILGKIQKCWVRYNEMNMDLVFRVCNYQNGSINLSVFKISMDYNYSVVLDEIIIHKLRDTRKNDVVMNFQVIRGNLMMIFLGNKDTGRVTLMRLHIPDDNRIQRIEKIELPPEITVLKKYGSIKTWPLVHIPRRLQGMTEYFKMNGIAMRIQLNFQEAVVIIDPDNTIQQMFTGVITVSKYRERLLFMPHLKSTKDGTTLSLAYTITPKAQSGDSHSQKHIMIKILKKIKQYLTLKTKFKHGDIFKSRNFDPINLSTTISTLVPSSQKSNQIQTHGENHKSKPKKRLDLTFSFYNNLGKIEGKTKYDSQKFIYLKDFLKQNDLPNFKTKLNRDFSIYRMFHGTVFDIKYACESYIEERAGIVKVTGPKASEKKVKFFKHYKNDLVSKTIYPDDEIIYTCDYIDWNYLPADICRNSYLLISNKERMIVLKNNSLSQLNLSYDLRNCAKQVTLVNYIITICKEGDDFFQMHYSLTTFSHSMQKMGSSMNTGIEFITLSVNLNYLIVTEHNEDYKKTKLMMFAANWWSGSSLVFEEKLLLTFKEDEILVSIKRYSLDGVLIDRVSVYGITCMTTNVSKCTLKILVAGLAMTAFSNDIRKNRTTKKKQYSVDFYPYKLLNNRKNITENVKLVECYEHIVKCHCLIIHFPIADDFMIYNERSEGLGFSEEKIDLGSFLVFKIVNPFFGISVDHHTPPVINEWLYIKASNFKDYSYLCVHKVPHLNVMKKLYHIRKNKVKNDEIVYDPERAWDEIDFENFAIDVTKYNKLVSISKPKLDVSQINDVMEKNKIIHLLDHKSNFYTLNYTTRIGIEINNLFLESTYVNVTAIGPYNSSHTIQIQLVKAIDPNQPEFNSALLHYFSKTSYYIDLVIIGSVAILIGLLMGVFINTQDIKQEKKSDQKDKVSQHNNSNSQSDNQNTESNIINGTTFAKFDPHDLSQVNEKQKKQRQINEFKGEMPSEIMDINVER